MERPSFMMNGEFSAFEEKLKGLFPEHRASKGDVIFGGVKRDNRNHYYLLSGCAESFFVHERGGAAQLVMRGPGTIFPLYYSFSSTSMENVLEIRAIENCSYLSMPKSDLRNLLKSDSDFALAMIDAYAKFANYLDYSLSSRLFDPLQTAVASFIYLNCDTEGRLPYTHERIAGAVGASRARVSTIISSFVKKGILETRKGSIVVKDKGHLRGLCSYTAAS